MNKFVVITKRYPGACTDQISDKERFISNPVKLMETKGYEGWIAVVNKEKLAEKEKVTGVTVKRYKNTFDLLFSLQNDKEVVAVYSFLRPNLASILTALLSKKTFLVPLTYILGSNWLIKTGSIFLMKRFNRIIALTPHERDIYIKAGIPKHKIELMPFSIDYDVFSKKPDNLDTIRKKYGIKENDFTIVTVANFRACKNIEIILKAFRLFHEKVSSSKLIIVGDDLLDNKLFKEQKNVVNVTHIKKLIEDQELEDSVVQTGALDYFGVRDTMHVSRVYVSSSSIEAQGLSVYEAGAAGVPLCLSTIGSFTSVFGDNALYHDPEDFKKLSENFMKYYKDDTLMAKNAETLKIKMKEWGFEISMKKMDILFDKIIKNNG